MSIKSLAERIGMDYDSVIEDFCGDVTALKDALRAFPSKTATAVLEECVKNMDMEGIRKEAHAIRKSAEKLGLGELRTSAARLEEVNAEKVPADSEHLIKLQREIAKAIEEEKL